MRRKQIESNGGGTTYQNLGKSKKGFLVCLWFEGGLGQAPTPLATPPPTDSDAYVNAVHGIHVVCLRGFFCIILIVQAIFIHGTQTCLDGQYIYYVICISVHTTERSF